MNYRHAYHAGNFADVVKHAVLALVLMHLRQKPAAFRVLDTHAGAGLYDLAAAEAEKTGEAQAGIVALRAATPGAAAAELLRPYLDAVAGFNPDGGLRFYPGSPALAGALLRAQDRLIACETQPEAAAALARLLARDKRAKAIAIDGWTALTAYLPPKERRGVVLIDPPFEEANEFARLAGALVAAHRKWPGGIYLAWYPLKDRRAADAFTQGMARAGLANVLRAELTVAPRAPGGKLGGSGLLVVNPPWRLDTQLGVLLPALRQALAGGKGGTRLDWLAREK